MGMEKALKEKFPLGGWRTGSNGVFAPAFQEGRILKEKFLLQFLSIPQSFSCLARNVRFLFPSLLPSCAPVPAACPPPPCQLAKAGPASGETVSPWS